MFHPDPLGSLLLPLWTLLLSASVCFCFGQLTPSVYLGDWPQATGVHTSGELGIFSTSYYLPDGYLGLLR